jgi:hypothetical protein
MPTHHTQPKNKIRASIAAEAARIMVQQQQNNFRLAKQKAAEHLGYKNKKNLPSNEEIQAALTDYLALFDNHSQQCLMRDRRQQALQTMQFFKTFHPLLASPLMASDAFSHSAICLHLFAETVEQFIQFLLERHIPFLESETSIRYARNQLKKIPTYTIFLENHEIQMVIFPPIDRKRTPLSSVTSKPMRRIALKDMQSFLQQV